MKVLFRGLLLLLFALVTSFGTVQAAPRVTRSGGPPPMQGPSSQLQKPNALLPIHVLVQSPAHTETELQIICLFRSDPTNTLHGSLTELNEKLYGLLDKVRKPTAFRGELGETLLITPAPGTIVAKKLLIIGLGDSQTFQPERMELVGSIAYHEANRLGVTHPFFAPTVLDGGVTRFTTGQVSEQVTLGMLRAEATAHLLHNANVQDMTYLAGQQYRASTQNGIDRAIAMVMAR